MNENSEKIEKVQRVKSLKSGGMVFAPGVSGNPAGKPKGTKHFSTLFNEMVREKIKLKDGTETTILRAMGMAMTRRAMSGDVKAFAEVADRLDGKAVQGLEIEVTERPQPIMPIKNRSVKLKGNEKDSLEQGEETGLPSLE